MAKRIIPRSPYHDLEERIENLESGGTRVTGEVPSGDIDGINVTFVTNNNFVSESLEIFLNGLKLSRGVGNDYTESSPNNFIMNYAPLPGDKIEVNYQESI